MLSPKDLPAMLRRRFLLVLGSMALAAGLDIRRASGRLPGDGQAADSFPQALFDNLEDAVVLGRRYLRDFPHEADERHLLNAVSAALGQNVSNCDYDALRRAIRDQLVRDFTDGDTVILDGWVLSRCEARLWALASMR